MIDINFITYVLNLKESNIIDLEKSYVDTLDDFQYYHIYLLINSFKCPICNSMPSGVKDTKTLSPIRHSIIGGLPAYIVFHKRRYHCNKCNKLFSERLSIMNFGRTTSDSLFIEVLESLMDYTVSYEKVALKYNISPTKVIDIFDKCEDIKRLKLPEVLCIDEVYAKKLTKKKYCCVLMDPINNKIIDVLNTRKKVYLEPYFRRISLKERSNTKYVVMDLFEPYKRVIKSCFNDVIIAADSFHVIKQLNDCFKAVRIRIMKQYSYLKKVDDYNYWILKSFWKVLQSNFDKVNGKFKIRKYGTIIDKHKLLHDMLLVSDELKDAYELKEEYREFNLTCNYENAPEEIEYFIEKFNDSKSPEMRKFGRLLAWKNEIINSFIRINGMRLSNSRIERANRNIKTLMRLSYGIQNFWRSRNRIMYSLNKGTKLTINFDMKTNKRKGKKRGKYKIKKERKSI